MIFCNIISNLDFAKRLPGHSLSVHQKGSLRAKSCTNMGREAATYLCHSSNFLLMHCSSKFSFWWGLCTCPYAYFLSLSLLPVRCSFVARTFSKQETNASNLKSDKATLLIYVLLKHPRLTILVLLRSHLKRRSFHISFTGFLKTRKYI